MPDFEYLSRNEILPKNVFLDGLPDIIMSEYDYPLLSDASEDMRIIIIDSIWMPILREAAQLMAT